VVPSNRQANPARLSRYRVKPAPRQGGEHLVVLVAGLEGGGGWAFGLLEQAVGAAHHAGAAAAVEGQAEHQLGPGRPARDPAADRQQHLEVRVRALSLRSWLKLPLSAWSGLSATPWTLSSALAGRW